MTADGDGADSSISFQNDKRRGTVEKNVERIALKPAVLQASGTRVMLTRDGISARAGTFCKRVEQA